MPAVQLRAAGDGYILDCLELGIVVHAWGLRETDSRTYVRLQFTSLATGRPLLAPVQLNLWETAGRERLARALQARMSAPASTAADLVEATYNALLEEVARPAEVVDLSELPLPPDEGWLVYPLLARGQTNILLADQESGKSYLALRLAMSIALGLDNLPEPLRLCGQGPVLYVDAETEAAVQRRRLEKLALGLRLTHLPRIRYQYLARPLSECGAQLRALVDRLQPAAVVFDSLTYLAGGDLNKTEVAVPTMNVIRSLATTRLVIAHHGKAGRQEQRPSVLGSAAFEFQSRTIWLLRRSSQPSEAYTDLAFVHHKGSESGRLPTFALRLEFEDRDRRASYRTIDLLSVAAFEKLSPAQERIARFLAERTERSATAKEVAEYLELTVPAVKWHLRRMPNVQSLAASERPGRGDATVWKLLPPSTSPSTFSAAPAAGEPPDGKVESGSSLYRDTNTSTFPADAGKWKVESGSSRKGKGPYPFGNWPDEGELAREFPL